MSIPHLTEEAFKEILRANLTPARAISNPQHLRGRELTLRQIDRAFNSPGRHVFIHGDRGVGKTSLAQSAASIYQSSDNDPIMVACDQKASFFQLMQSMARLCLPPDAAINKTKNSANFSLKFFGISAERGSAIEKGDIPLPATLNDAILLMKYVCQFHSREPIVIIDEFDQLTTTSERKYFADLIKQVSDQAVPVRFILCGIGSSLEELIGTHFSTDRYLTPIPLEPLTHDARWKIVTSAAEALSVTIDRELYIRIGFISDGFPYYVHLICEQIFWMMFDDPELALSCRAVHFTNGITQAVNETQTSLKMAYEKATQKYSNDYEEVLWAVAAHKILRRQISDIYSKSYVPIMKDRPHRTTLTQERFNQRLIALAKDSHGKMLVSMGAGWYEFRENIIRGYVRLLAANAGVNLDGDHFMQDHTE